jgi:hypothetical protein
MMAKFSFLLCLPLALNLAACSPGSDTGSANADADEVEAARDIARALVQGDPDPNECGQGGTDCPMGLECVTWYGGVQACGPVAVEGLVLITDATLGGSCLVENDIDKVPGASIASVHVVDTDGSVLGWGRMVWDEPGFAVAEERGDQPDGTPFTGDACTTAYNLGCDGKAAFEIIDESGQPQKLREGQNLFVHIRGAETCGDPVEDGIEAIICTDPSAARGGNLDSCSWRVRTVELPEGEYGPDRFGGTLGN